MVTSCHFGKRCGEMCMVRSGIFRYEFWRELRIWDDWFKKTRTLVVVYVLSMRVVFTSGWLAVYGTGVASQFCFYSTCLWTQLCRDVSLCGSFHLALLIWVWIFIHIIWEVLLCYMHTLGVKLGLRVQSFCTGGRQYVRRAEAPAVQEWDRVLKSWTTQAGRNHFSLKCDPVLILLICHSWILSCSPFPPPDRTSCWQSSW